jgi:hypothetical protein
LLLSKFRKSFLRNKRPVNVCLHLAGEGERKFRGAMTITGDIRTVNQDVLKVDQEDAIESES